ncbi:flagellar basal body P-ring formation chaperone FlgA [Pseudoduganella aquatica]|uniref:flagellar basal body P-ring formation chaperone FlgA n=1 Tax=Pseudoduganella aquatica TaxID=2660641 RepID=UPI001E353AF9|nr:flagellar basal body P-ring formation chaperone FlgA [Pseudoduganella aquatica]
MPISGEAAVTPEQTVALVEQTAREALLRQADASGLAEAEFEVAAVRTSRPLPACPSPVAVGVLDARQATRLRLVASCPGEGGWKYEFVVRAKITARVAVMAAEVPSGRAVEAADVALERRDISLVPDAVSDLALLEGMSARRSLRSGELLRQNMLTAQLLVKRGEAVRIVARNEQIEVSMAGEALDPGARGALIRVRNNNGNVIKARVTGAGMVEPADLPVSIQSPK